MKKIIIPLLLGISAVINAQNTLSGTVTDNESQPVKGVSVYAPEFHKGTSTDENGKYKLSDLPNGKVKLSFVFVGFITQNKTIDIPRETTLDIMLEPAV